jgi:hypothetical protein
MSYNYKKILREAYYMLKRYMIYQELYQTVSNGSQRFFFPLKTHQKNSRNMLKVRYYFLKVGSTKGNIGSHLYYAAAYVACAHGMKAQNRNQKHYETFNS